MNIIKLIDKKIIQILSYDSRIRITQIAKKLNIKTDRVKYRIDRLFEKQILLNYKTRINYKKLGYQEFTIYLKIKKIDLNIKKEIEQKLINNQFIFWVGTITGDFDFRINILAKNNEDLKEKLNQIEKELSYNLQRIMIFGRLETISTNRYPTSTYFSSKEEIKELKKIKIDFKNYFNNINNKIKLDKKDFIIINELNKNTKITFKELSKILNISSEDVRYRYQKILKTNIIKSFGISINPEKLNYLWTIFLIKIEHRENELNLINFLKSHEQVTTIHKFIGEWDYEITFMAKNIEEINNFIILLRSNFFKNIIDYKLLHTKDSLKNPEKSEGIFKEILKEKNK